MNSIFNTQQQSSLNSATDFLLSDDVGFELREEDILAAFDEEFNTQTTQTLQTTTSTSLSQQRKQLRASQTSVSSNAAVSSSVSGASAAVATASESSLVVTASAVAIISDEKSATGKTDATKTSAAASKKRRRPPTKSNSTVATAETNKTTPHAQSSLKTGQSTSVDAVTPVKQKAEQEDFDSLSPAEQRRVLLHRSELSVGRLTDLVRFVVSLKKFRSSELTQQLQRLGKHFVVQLTQEVLKMRTEQESTDTSAIKPYELREAYMRLTQLTADSPFTSIQQCNKKRRLRR